MGNIETNVYRDYSAKRKNEPEKAEQDRTTKTAMDNVAIEVAPDKVMKVYHYIKKAKKDLLNGEVALEDMLKQMIDNGMDGTSFKKVGEKAKEFIKNAIMNINILDKLQQKIRGVREAMEDKYTIIARGVSDENIAKEIANRKKGKVVTDPDNEGKYMVVLAEKSLKEDSDIEPVKNMFSTDTAGQEETAKKKELLKKLLSEVENDDEIVGKLLCFIEQLLTGGKEIEDLASTDDEIVTIEVVEKYIVEKAMRLLFEQKLMTDEIIDLYLKDKDLFWKVYGGEISEEEKEKILADIRKEKEDKVVGPYKEKAEELERKYEGYEVLATATSKEIAEKTMIEHITEIRENNGVVEVIAKNYYSRQEVKEMLEKIKEDVKAYLETLNGKIAKANESISKKVEEIADVKEVEILEKKLALLDKLLKEE